MSKFFLCINDLLFLPYWCKSLLFTSNETSAALNILWIQPLWNVHVTSLHRQIDDTNKICMSWRGYKFSGMSPHCNHTHTFSAPDIWVMGITALCCTLLLLSLMKQCHMLFVYVLRHVLTAGRTSSTQRKTVKTTNCPTASVIATAMTWDMPNPSFPATEVHKHTLTPCIGSVFSSSLSTPNYVRKEMERFSDVAFLEKW